MATASENLITLQNAKLAIKEAIIAKGQDMTDVPFTQYAEKIAAIVGGEGGGGDNRRITKGTVTFDSDNGNQTIAHNLGVVPSVFIMLVKDKTLNFTIGAEDAPPAGIYGFIWVNEAVVVNNFVGENLKSLKEQFGFSLEWRNSGTTALHWTADTGNITEDKMPTATTITTPYRSSQYKYLAGVEYEWIAIAEGDQNVDTSFIEFTDLLLKRPLDREIELTIPNGVKYLGYSAIASWYKKNTTYGLVKINLNEVETIADGALQNNMNLAEIVAPNLTILTYDCFYNAQKLVKVHFPNVISAADGNAFRNCINLKVVDFDKLEVFNAQFTSCPVLEALIIRTPKVCTLKGVINTNNTAFYDGTASIYVPDDLVEQYKSATNWTAHSEIIKPLSEYAE